MQDVQTLPWADTDSDHNLLVAKICTRLKKNHKVPAKMGYEVQDTLEQTLSATECQSENVEVQWNITRNVIWMGKLTGKQERHVLHRKWRVKWMNKGHGRMSTMKKEWRT